MKFLLSTFLLILVVCSASCDGRDRVYKTNTDVLKENKLLDSFSENVTFIPDTYTQVVTDTILSNGFRIKIETYSDMKESILNTVTSDAIIHKKYYREFKSNVVVYKDDKEILSKQIDKPFFAKNFETLNTASDNLVLSSVFVDQEIQTNNDETKIDVNYYHPINNYYLNFRIIVNETGDFKILNS